ncbi:ATP-binding cassette domain-containing protein [Gemella haemolysans]|uniref:ATP-binding cassette domain-containing protein n=1 Tax=Gemella haemolysans TaxID=1379 RepID=A0AAW6B1X4_9BACL|nr:ATP-binding cassette domain-containing protein [Gemella haemolysans]MDB6186167.1 ATP-binding cassette domain-containing protein [Gemella haemolysans]MDU4714283.1 ATP-binding cassette domain-containing protein [Gemella haemolysans]
MKIDGRAMALFNIKKEVYLVAILKLVAFWCSLFFIYNFVDFLFYSLGEESRSGAVLGFILKTVVGLVVYYAATTGDNYFSHKISKQVRNTLRKEIYNKVEKLSLNYTEAVNTGSLLVMNSSSIVNIEFYFNKFVPQMFATLFIVLSSFVIYGKIHILLFIAMLLLYPLIPVSIMIIIKKSKKANKKNFSDFLSLSEVFYDRLSGFTTAKIYGKEDNVASDVDTRSAKYRKSTMALLRHQLNSINVMDAITYISIFVLSIIAIFAVKDQKLIVFVIVASLECFKPLRALGGLFHISMKGNVELDNIYKLLDHPEQEKDETIEVEAGKNIVLNNVSFSYGEETTLENINMIFKPGTKTALVGESGSGKSTIIKLILGLNSNYSGSIKYDNFNIDSIPTREMAKITTLITNDSYLVKGTVREHLSVRKNITEEEMYNALEKVNLRDFVEEHGGLDYELAIGAANLSGGQKQRLLAAKAILKDSYLYILDEAVSNIDDYSKEIVLNAFDSIKEGKIIIVISHDLETITNSDNIYVLKDKKIIEEGTHDELIVENSLYRKLFTDQQQLKSKFLAKEVE